MVNKGKTNSLIPLNILDPKRVIVHIETGGPVPGGGDTSVEWVKFKFNPPLEDDVFYVAMVWHKFYTYSMVHIKGYLLEASDSEGLWFKIYISQDWSWDQLKVAAFEVDLKDKQNWWPADTHVSMRVELGTSGDILKSVTLYGSTIDVNRDYLCGLFVWTNKNPKKELHAVMLLNRYGTMEASRQYTLPTAMSTKEFFYEMRYKQIGFR